MNEDKLYEFQIPDNVLDSKRVFGFRPRNWIEGIICAGIVGFIIAAIPFVLRVKLIFMVCLCGPILLLNLVGIKDQSVFEAIMIFRQALANKGEYHLRSANHEERYKSGRMAQSVNGIGNGDSAADKVAEFVKAKYEEFKERRA
ncbi:hypothetical protein bpr_IV008 (plasmid) [Butyrivibrio proteoclasticus B316]|uniref:PrgI family protein n=1 Tax=Butyrivibrio proteoclasticus (strain ATCC 51982 / DSM 14932 / B316) TaxID=515622 RepID=E0S4P1_BUTPB|nr:hypothetical protein [Butyrivibrio proteoclasticus]ADL36373.1 hypothetical protein bpr_IV008 [Butyrivibrio proteoclasticus B316]